MQDLSGLVPCLFDLELVVSYVALAGYLSQTKFDCITFSNRMMFRAG